MIRIGLLGARGRMGHWISELVQKEFSSKAQLSVAVNRGDSFEALLDTHVVIDFSSSSAMTALAQLALHRNERLPAFVIGSTGWASQDHQILEKLSESTLVLEASNFSVGVYITSEILRQFSPLLNKMGYVPVLVEAHHSHKKDAPSGTALSFQRAMDPINPSQIQTHSIRAGETIGEHQVTYYGQADRIRIEHEAQDRSIFARGAIQVALWLAGKRKDPQKKQGLLGIQDYFSDLYTQRK